MLQYSHEQLAIIISIPIVTIFLVWTTAIFFKNRRKWAPYDIPIVSLFILSIIRNLTILSYVLVLTLNKHIFNIEYCAVLVWIFNSTHTFQASNLSTIAVIGLLSSKLRRKNQNLTQFLNSTHVLYHLFCLFTLCACVGVAALLARHNNSLMAAEYENLTTSYGGSSTGSTINPCKLMPFDLDLKYSVFVLVLHVFLASVSLFCFLFTCVNLYKSKKRRNKNDFEYMKKSNSDISESSLSNNNTMVIMNGSNNNNEKSYYDTYTVQRGCGAGATSQVCHQNFFIGAGAVQNHHHAVGYCHHQQQQQQGQGCWNSDMSNLSTTVSSTNSRKPCLPKSLSEEIKECKTGLETINPILIVCYLVYHVPVLVLCIHPKLLHPWPVAGIVLWLGLVQDILLPIGLGLVDTRFSNWVSYVYRCSGSRLDEKLPHVGLDGKFRPFGSQPQSLEIVQIAQERNLKNVHSIEHRFPITNGSLYTSLDGRLPVIHNYRRHKEPRNRYFESQKYDQSSSNQSIHTSHLKRPDMPSFNCLNCETDLCPSHSNLHHLSPDYINRKLNALHHNANSNNNNIIKFQNAPLRNTLSHESLRHVGENVHHPFLVNSSPINNSINNNSVLKNSRNLLRLNRMKLSRSEDSLCDINKVRDFREVKMAKESNRSDKTVKNKLLNEQILDYSSSDEDYNEMLTNQHQNFDTLSTKSSCSITTEANGDFHFYQSSHVKNDDNNNKNNTNGEILRDNINEHLEKLNDDLLLAKYSRFDASLDSFAPKNHKLAKRTHSKRSLEDFQAFLEDRQHRFNNNNALLRRSSFGARANLDDYVKDRNKIKCNNGKLLRSNSKKLSDFNYCSHNLSKKIKSVEYLPNKDVANNTYLFDVDVCKYDVGVRVGSNGPGDRRYVGSAPDLKKIFISEYI